MTAVSLHRSRNRTFLSEPSAGIGKVFTLTPGCRSAFLSEIAGLAVVVQATMLLIRVSPGAQRSWGFVLPGLALALGGFVTGRTLANLPREAQAVAQEILEPSPPATGRSPEDNAELRTALTRILLSKGERSESLAALSLDELVAKVLRSEQPKKIDPTPS